MSCTVQSTDGETFLTLESALKLVPTTRLDYIWSSWATELDRSRVMYVLPNDYDILAHATGHNIPYVEVTCGSIKMRLIGHKSRQKVASQFSHENFLMKDNAMIQFARILNKDVRDPKMAAPWERSFTESLSRFRFHRCLVRNIGKLLGIDTDGHGLTKTTLVLFALGYLRYWPVQKPADDDIRKKAACRVVVEGHLTQEDHHLEFLGDRVNVDKLFCDRLATHLEKCVFGEAGGWDMDERLIPIQLIRQWRAFREKHGHIDLIRAYRMDSMEDCVLTRMKQQD